MTGFVVGLTGGIGSGKSAAAERFAALGAAVVDTDAIAHELTAPGGAAMPALRAAFGDAIATAEGGLDRPAMRALAFSDAAARRRLESLLHPLIRAEALRRCEAALAAGAPYALLVVPLLVESGSYRERLARVAVVDCAEDTQVARVMARNRMSRDEVTRIMAAQAGRQQRLAAADDILANDDGLPQLWRQVDALHGRYLEMAATCGRS